MKQSSEGTFFMGLQSIYVCSLYYSNVDFDINFWPGWTVEPDDAITFNMKSSAISVESWGWLLSVLLLHFSGLL